MITLKCQTQKGAGLVWSFLDGLLLFGWIGITYYNCYLVLTYISVQLQSFDLQKRAWVSTVTELLS